MRKGEKTCLELQIMLNVKVAKIQTKARRHCGMFLSTLNMFYMYLKQITICIAFWMIRSPEPSISSLKCPNAKQMAQPIASTSAGTGAKQME